MGIARLCLTRYRHRTRTDCSLFKRKEAPPLQAGEDVTTEISKHDWKVYCKKLAQWQERYIEVLIEEYGKIINDGTQLASDKFWQLEKRIRKDRKHPGVVIEVRRSDAILNIVYFYRAGMISEADLEGFSEDLQDIVHSLCAP